MVSVHQETYHYWILSQQEIIVREGLKKKDDTLLWIFRRPGTKVKEKTKANKRTVKENKMLF